MTDNHKKLKVWLMQHGEPPPMESKDVAFRTARLSKELATRGHDVTYWCSSFWHHKKQFFSDKTQVIRVDNYNLSVLHAGGYNTNHSLSRFLHHKKMASLFAQEARKREKPDIIVAGLPIHNCAYEAVKYGIENHIPVIVDLRDYWPDNYLMLFPKKLQWLGRWIFKRDFEITKFALKNATALVGMMSHMLEWGRAEYAKRGPIDDDKVFFIGGEGSIPVPPENVYKLFPALQGKIQGRFVVNYIGGFSFLNHPMGIIEAAKHLNASGLKDRFLFVLAGKGDYYNRCVRAAEGLDNVLFLGWLDSQGIATLNSVSSVGVIPSYEKISFPNKAFSYLGAGLPILSSERGDLNRLLEQYEAGSYFEISDPKQLADRILALSKLDKQAHEKIKANSMALFQEHLHSNKIYRDFADYVEQMAAKFGKQNASNTQKEPVANFS